MLFALSIVFLLFRTIHCQLLIHDSGIKCSETDVDLIVCEPGEDSHCPDGFACRPCTANDKQRTDLITYLCCESKNMSIDQWFVELNLSPQAIPQTPASTIQSVFINDFANLSSPEIAINDEVQVVDYPNYVVGTVKTIIIDNTTLTRGGYLHVILLIAPLHEARAIFLNYNYPSEGENTINLNLHSGQESFLGVNSNHSVELLDSYRYQYVVLLFKTLEPLSNNTIIKDDLGTYLTKSASFFTHTNTGRTLGRPIAATFFYLTTRRTLFPIEAFSTKEPSNSGNHSSLISLLNLFIIIILIKLNC